MHKLLEKNAYLMLGRCAVCGPVDLALNSRGYVQCAVARREQRKSPNRHTGLLSRAGMTREEAAALRAGKPCAICGKPAQAVDHDHQTGAVRGVLCHKCNTGIGFLGDSPERLESAIRYLRAH